MSRRTLARAAAGLCLLAVVADPASSDVKARAYAVYVHLPEYGIRSTYHGDTGWLSGRSGGHRSGPPGGIWHGDVLQVRHHESDSDGDPCRGRSGARLEGGHLFRGERWEVRWDRVESADEDTCCRSSDRDDIASVFIGLTFGGRPVEVTGEPNQTISLGGTATLVINERHRDEDETDDGCDHDAGEHRALHLILPRGQEVILGATRFDSDDHCCSPTGTAHSTWGRLKSHYR